MSRAYRSSELSEKYGFYASIFVRCNCLAMWADFSANFCKILNKPRLDSKVFCYYEKLNPDLESKERVNRIVLRVLRTKHCTFCLRWSPFDRHSGWDISSIHVYWLYLLEQTFTSNQSRLTFIHLKRRRLPPAKDQNDTNRTINVEMLGFWIKVWRVTKMHELQHPSNKANKFQKTNSPNKVV